VIERIFGVLKKRFKILVSTPEFSTSTQACLICALAVVHNFIRIHDPEDMPEPVEGENGECTEEGGLRDGISPAERSRASERRDVIAAAMWAAYEWRGASRHCRRL
jgi:hypothetical protein